tara:strand:- start:248 stop:445 length:198 start_codon:yes stop_codon:yes gene_type:complete
MASNSSDVQAGYAVELNIELEDLHELAKINPLAWEQLMHIVDNRQKDQRIAELEIQLSQKLSTTK